MRCTDDSDKLLFVNHPMTCNRYGYGLPGHLPTMDHDVRRLSDNFLPELKHLSTTLATTFSPTTFATVVLAARRTAE